MNKTECCIVLCRPEESRNVGSVCRAMKNMGLKDLRIVGNKTDYSEEQVRTLALHAADIWESAVFFEPTIGGLRSALSDCSLSGGTTRRMGQKRKSWGMTPEQFVDFATAPGNGRAAIVFGNERAGLSIEELSECSVAVNIPSDDGFPSLNLSHAVQIMTYTFFRKTGSRKKGYEPISTAQLSELIDSISDSLKRSGLYQNPGRERNDQFLTSIFARAALSASEAQHLEILFRKIAHIKTEKADTAAAEL